MNEQDAKGAATPKTETSENARGGESLDDRSDDKKPGSASSPSSLGSWLSCEQPRLGAIGTLVLLVFASILTPLALDMYTPAIPHMVGFLNTTADLVNLTLVGFFAFNAIGLLLFGTVSDKYGRKPVLVCGAIAYTVGSACCAVAPTIELLIAMRIIQALGAGAVGAIGTAVVKDAFKPSYREKVLSVVQVMFVVGPVFAPVIGATLLQFTDWRGIFATLAVIGLLILIMSLMFHESLPARERTHDDVLPTIGHLTWVLKSKPFVMFLLTVAMFNIPFMGYIAVGSYIYIDAFGLSELGYSAFFAVGAVAGSVGPFIWLFAQKFMNARQFTTLILAVCLVAGVSLMLFGDISEYSFCVLFVLFILAESCARPYSTNILLNQHDGETGAASSVINFTHTIFGCVGMLCAVFPWPSYMFGVGALVTISIAISICIWFYALKNVKIRGINA